MKAATVPTTAPVSASYAIIGCTASLSSSTTTADGHHADLERKGAE